MGLAVTREKGDELAHLESTDDSNATDEALTDRLTELDYALIFHGQPGDKVEGIERNIPGKNFGESLRMFLRLLGLPLGLPLEFILLDWTQSNYSQSRAVMEQAYQTFMLWQEKLDTFFFSPLLEWKLDHWKESGLIRTTNIEYEWIKPTFPWIDQVKEADAYGKKVDRSFMTHAQVCKSLNTDRTDVITTRENEIAEALTIAQRLNEKFPGARVPWQIFAGLEAPGAAKAPGKPAAEPAPADETNNEDEDQDNAH